MRDLDVRPVFREWLISRFCGEPNSLIIEELGLCQGSVRADFAVVNGLLRGYEIKSEKDTLARLGRQVPKYNDVFDRVSIVVAERHLKKATTVVPEWWGISVIREESAGACTIEVTRPEMPNPSIDPRSLVQLLWKDEVAALLLNLDSPQSRLSSKPRRLLWEHLVQATTLSELQAATRSALKVRQDWRVVEAQRPDGVRCQRGAKLSNSLGQQLPERTRQYSHRPS
jgi:hypothetical protein